MSDEPTEREESLDDRVLRLAREAIATSRNLLRDTAHAASAPYGRLAGSSRDAGGGQERGASWPGESAPDRE